MFICPQCGENTENLNEGYCDICHDYNQEQLNLHNAQYTFWNSLTDNERNYYIKKCL